MEKEALQALEQGVFQGYHTGLTVYEERFEHGTLTAAGWNGAGFSQDLLEKMPSWIPIAPMAVSATFSVEINGISQPDTWEKRGFETKEVILENGTKVLDCVLELQNRLFPLRVRVLTRLDGTAVLTRSLEWCNDGTEPLNLSRFCLMGGEMEHTDLTGTAVAPEEVYSLGYFDSTDWAMEGLFRRKNLPLDETSFSGRFRRSRHRHPMFLLNNRRTGSVFFAQLAYTGGYTMLFDLRRTARGVALAYRIELDGEQPLLILRPGETFRTPEVHIGRMNGDDDAIIGQMHEHIRRSVYTLPEAENAIPGGLIEAGIGPEHEMTPESLFILADQAAEAGADLVFADAGWFCPPGKEEEWRDRVGDWIVDPERFPQGMKPVRDYVHSKGMLFGLWMDAERFGIASEAFRAHPEWIARPYGEKSSTMIRLSDPAALAYIEEQIAHLIESEKLDFFRLDCNVSSYEIDYPLSDRADGTLRYYDAVYGMYERLRRRFPKVVFENCAGGGGRSDLGMARYFTHTWVSDWQMAPRSLAIVNGMTMVLPPERVDRMMACMGAHEFGSLDQMVRQSLFGRPTLTVMTAPKEVPNQLQMDFVRHSLEIYKEYIRPYATSGRIYHLTEEAYGTSPEGTIQLERLSADGKIGVLAVFALAGDQPSSITVFPRGLRRDLRYRVTFDNSGDGVELDGFRILQEGLRVELPAALSSELILIRAVSESD